MNDQRPSSIRNDSSPDKSRRDWITAETGALFGAVIGGAIGMAFADRVGMLIGALIGAIIGWLIGSMLSWRDEAIQREAKEAVLPEKQSVAAHPSATTVGGMSRNEADVSHVRRSEEAATSISIQPGWKRVDRSGAVNVPLSSEQLEVDKRELDAGRLRLRKIVKTEVVHVPVKLRREEIIVERVEPGAAPSADPGVILQAGDKEIVIPLVKEEPVIQKEAKVFSEVHVHKVVRTEMQTVHETLRREEVKVDRKGSA